MDRVQKDINTSMRAILIDCLVEVHRIQEEKKSYLGFIYTYFQECATFISHGNTASQAKGHGDLNLTHENAYTKIIEKLFKIDPDGTVLAFADMMRKISMHAHLSLKYKSCTNSENALENKSSFKVETKFAHEFYP